VKKAELEARVRELEEELAGCNKMVARLRRTAERSGKERKRLEDDLLAGARKKFGADFELKWDYFQLRYEHYRQDGETNKSAARRKANDDLMTKFDCDPLDDDSAKKKLLNLGR
jgi:hypothetical protein